MNTSPYLGIAATACALFVVVLLVMTWVLPMMASVSAAIEAVGR